MAGHWHPAKRQRPHNPFTIRKPSFVFLNNFLALAIDRFLSSHKANRTWLATCRLALPLAAGVCNQSTLAHGWKLQKLKSTCDPVDRYLRLADVKRVIINVEDLDAYCSPDSLLATSLRLQSDPVMVVARSQLSSSHAKSFKQARHVPRGVRRDLFGYSIDANERILRTTMSWRQTVSRKELQLSKQILLPQSQVNRAAEVMVEERRERLS